MTPLETQLVEDRDLRDSALRLFKQDLALIREDLRERGVGARLADRIGDGTMDMVEDAVGYAEDNKGKVAAAVAAVVLWFARGPILHGIAALFAEAKPEPQGIGARLKAINPFGE